MGGRKGIRPVIAASYILTGGTSWCNGYGVGQGLVRPKTKRARVRFPAMPLSRNNPTPVVREHCLRHETVYTNSVPVKERCYAACGWRGNSRYASQTSVVYPPIRSEMSTPPTFLVGMTHFTLLLLPRFVFVYLLVFVYFCKLAPKC